MNRSASLAMPAAVRLNWLARLGDAMQRHRRVIQGIQWGVVAIYVFLVVLPAFLPLPAQGATILNNLTLFAQFIFWGIWWPFVILSMLLLGRVWCGVLCPEGTLTEFASRHGRGLAIPSWVRWGGWPFVAFVLTTVYGQLISVYEYPKAVLIILGGSTAAAMVVGFLYGRNVRVWCRYLCPVNGVFGLLARLAPIHFRVDPAAWKRYPARTPAVNCAPLLDIKHMRSASQCHACGRCSSHRGAVELAARPPNREVLQLQPRDITQAEALLLIFGLLGVAVGAFQWTSSPWFVSMKQRFAEWLVNHNAFGLLQDNAPWWLLTHYPEANDVFTWLDGLSILLYIGVVAAIVGGITLLALQISARIVGSARLDWKVLTMALIPLAGIGVFLGLSMLPLTMLKAEGVVLSWVPMARLCLLGGATLWSGWLGCRLLLSRRQKITHVFLAALVFMLPLALINSAWALLFFVW